jgi:hypothetical protein
MAQPTAATSAKSSRPRAPAAGGKPADRQPPPEAGPTATKNRSNPVVSAIIWLAILSAIAFGLYLIVLGGDAGFQRGVGVNEPTTGPIPQRYDPDRSMGYLKQLCDLGPRPSGSPAMFRQQDLLESFFEQRGATVTQQSFETRHPNDGSPVTMTNLIASWHPERPRRFLFCAHYDTRPYPDRDPVNKRGVFVGANDGASGTAGLMELANQLQDLPPDIGVDLVLFDGEEFVWNDRRDRYFIGSTYFAQAYKDDPPENPYIAGVLFDMIGDRELKLYYEANSLRYAKSVAHSFWDKAEQLGVQAFVKRQRHDIRDDHLPLNQIANIPTIDVIDFDYPRPGIGAPSYWHTQQDVPENCSGESIAAVVWVAHQWLVSQSTASKRSNR